MPTQIPTTLTAIPDQPAKFYAYGSFFATLIAAFLIVSFLVDIFTSAGIAFGVAFAIVGVVGYFAEAPAIAFGYFMQEREGRR